MAQIISVRLSRLLLPIVMVTVLATISPLSYLQTNFVALKLRNIWVENPRWVQEQSCADQDILQDINRYLSHIKASNSGDINLVHAGWVLLLKGACQDLSFAELHPGDKALFDFEQAMMGELGAIDDSQRVEIADYLFHFGNSRKTPLKDYLLNLAFEINPTVKNARVLAVRYQEVGNDTGTAALWQRIVQTVPDAMAEHWWAVAELATLEEDWAVVGQAYAHGAGIADDPYEYWMRSGGAWEKAGDWDAAINSYQQAHKISPSLLMPYLSLGHTYRAQEQYTDALDWYAQAEQRYPDNYAPFYFQGLTYYLMEDYVQAQNYLNVSVTLSPNLALGPYYLAQVAYRQGDLDKAELWLIRAIERQSSVPAVFWWWLELGEWKMARHNCAGALQAYSSAYDLGITGRQSIVQARLDEIATVCRIHYQLDEREQ
jgi:tetratricopeptide (TPR) repeat protein